MDAALAHTLRTLQRTAGNRAVGRLVAPRATPRLLARFESPEHQDLGDKYFRDLAAFVGTAEGAAWVKQYGLGADMAGMSTDPLLAGGRIRVGDRKLTPGEIISLHGDFYATPEALEKADPKEIDEILAAIERERRGELSGAQANATYQAITLRHRSRDQSFLELAKRNEPHFTPGNRKAWRALHERALEMARGATEDPAAFDRALMFDAAAGHFLTDAFSAGHLFDKSKLETAIEQHLRAHPARPQNPEMSMYYGLVQFKGAMGQLVLKNIHDRLNGEGVDVTNGRGMAWRTYGDAQLKKAPDTQRIAALAVYVSRHQVQLASTGAKPDPDAVLAFLPDDRTVEKTTERAISYIPAAVDQVTDLMYRQREMAKTELPPWLAPIITSNLATIGAPNRAQQVLDAQETARKLRLPTPAPQFTIFNF
jgi:hypothetical protein